MKLYLVRHGQTDYNLLNKFAGGKIDVPLNEKGLNQAKETKEILKNYDIDLIICSPMKRTRQTAEIINEDRHIEIIFDERLRERDLGELENKFHSEVNRDNHWNYYYDNPYDLESIKSVEERTFSFINDIKEKYNNRKILVVGHSGPFRLFDVYFYGIPEDGELLNLKFKNCEVKEYLVE